MPTTQEGRLMKIFTPLGEDFLLINRFVATEKISELFSFEVELLHEETSPGHAPTIVNAESLLGQGVTVSLTQKDGSARTFSGIVNHFAQGERNTRFSFYYMTIVPHVWVLTQKRQSRIFQNKSVTEILQIVLTGFEVSYEIQRPTEKRNYTVQYNETDFDFISRLMEEEGIFYYFAHFDGRHRMIIADSPMSHPACFPKSEISHFTKVSDYETPDFISTISQWKTNHRLQSGKVTFWDYHFQIPGNNFQAQQTGQFRVGESSEMEIYEYPGGYARKFDGISSTGGEQAAELNKIFNENSNTAEFVMQSLDAQYRIINAVSDCASITAGYKFTLTDHADAGDYLITSTIHEAEQNPSYVSDDEVESPYVNYFTCIAHGSKNPPFRPVRKTAKPVILGSQTAMIVGPSGEEIYTDKYGRVKVQFHWDREGQGDATSSCWVRVAQSWAGNKWGTMFIPRVGMEVIVHFLEGDPDQPIITGCVYNAQTMPPYTLPDEKTKSTIKSDSSKGGGGFNELRIEDKKGSEQIFVHGEKNLDVRIKNDAMELIQRDRHLIVTRNQHEKVTKDKHLTVGGDRNEKVDGSVSLTVGSDIQEKTGQKYALDAGQEIHLKSGMNVVIESGTNLTLKVGGNFININPGGVFIKGTMVMLNSGGSAGSGAGANPAVPTAPTEAVNAEPGSRNPAPKRNQPPPRPNFISPAASVLINAARTGTPFCEICSRT